MESTRRSARPLDPQEQRRVAASLGLSRQPGRGAAPTAQAMDERDRTDAFTLVSSHGRRPARQASALAYSPEGVLAVGDVMGQVQLRSEWGSTSRPRRAQFPALPLFWCGDESEPVSQVAWSADACCLAAVVGTSVTVKILDRRAAKPIVSDSMHFSHAEAPVCAVWRGEGYQAALVVASHGPTGGLLAQFTPRREVGNGGLMVFDNAQHEGRIRALAPKNCGPQLAVLSEAAAGQTRVASWPRHAFQPFQVQGEGRGASWSPDDQRLAVITTRELAIFNMQGPVPERTYGATHQSELPVYDVKWLNENLVVAPNKDHLTVLDAESGECVHTQMPGVVLALDVKREREVTVATACSDKKVYEWRANI